MAVLDDDISADATLSEPPRGAGATSGTNNTTSRKRTSGSGPFDGTGNAPSIVRIFLRPEYACHEPDDLLHGLNERLLRQAKLGVIRRGRLTPEWGRSASNIDPPLWRGQQLTSLIGRARWGGMLTRLPQLAAKKRVTC